MLDTERLLGNLLTGTLSRALGGRGASVLRTGVLGSRASVGLGLLGVAMAAFEHYQQANSATTMPPPAPLPASRAVPPPPPAVASHALPPPPPIVSSIAQSPHGADAATRQADARLLIRAMIAAAQADGRIDADERKRIAQATTGLTDDERAFLDAELATAHTIETLVVASRPEIAADVYAAAAHAIVADSDAERAWLARLGDALHVDAPLRDRIEQAMPHA